MKRILILAVIYISSMILGTLIFALLFMFNCNLSSFVTGLHSTFFSAQFFVAGAFLSLPLVCVLTQLLLTLYQIRHPQKTIVSFVTYTILGVFSWLVVIPTDLKLITRYESETVSARTDATSTGVFRKEESGIYFFTRITDEGKADGVFFDTTGYLGKEGSVIPLFDVPIKNDSAFPYSDSIIKNSLQPSTFVTWPLSLYTSLLTSALYSSSLGFLAWLAFASIGLALLSVYALQFASSWKMANVAFIICTGSCILLVNFFYYMNIMPDVLRDAVSKLTELTGAKDPLIILINLIVAILLTVFGVFMALYRFGTSNSEIEE